VAYWLRHYARSRARLRWRGPTATVTNEEEAGWAPEQVLKLWSKEEELRLISPCLVVTQTEIIWVLGGRVTEIYFELWGMRYAILECSRVMGNEVCYLGK
jgi:hypothetical protein